MTTPGLAAALRACADGIHAHEASIELLISHARWLHRSDFTSTLIEASGGMAAIDWTSAAAALACGELPCSSGERGVLQLAASLADDIPVPLGTAITSLDRRNIILLIRAILHASGQPGSFLPC
jgi:hypothetical protein